MASGDNTWFLVISPSDYSVHQQNGASAHNAGFIHQKCKEALRAVILKKTPDYLPHLNFLDLNRGSVLQVGCLEITPSQLELSRCACCGHVGDDGCETRA